MHGTASKCISENLPIVSRFVQTPQPEPSLRSFVFTVPTETFEDEKNSVMKAETYSLASRDKQITGSDVVSVKVKLETECFNYCT